MLLELDLSADQDRPRLDPSHHLHLGSLAGRGNVPSRGVACAWNSNSDRRQGLEAVRLPADHQLDDSVPDDHLGATICAGSKYGGAGLDDADFRLPHHLGHYAARAGHAAQACRRGLAGTAVIIGLDALVGLGGDIFAEIVILLATISFACATIFGLRLSDYDPMVVAAGSLLFGGLVLLPVSLIVDHPWTLQPTPQALTATVTMGIFSSAFGLMLFYMCLTRLGTLTTNAQGYLRIPIGVGLSVALLGESVPSNLALGLLLVMAGVAAMTIPGDAYRRWIKRFVPG